MDTMTAVLMAVALTGNFPGHAATGLEEDSAPVVTALAAHVTPGVCMDAVGTTVTDPARGLVDFPAVFLLDGNCEPLPGVESVEVF